MILLEEFAAEIGCASVPVICSSFMGNATYYYPGEYVAWLEKRLNNTVERSQANDDDLCEVCHLQNTCDCDDQCKYYPPAG